MPPPYATTLDDPNQRFLASLTEHGLELGLRTSEDFIRHFSPRAIMDALTSDAALRATLLEEAVGIKRKVGLRKSPASAGEDLQIALDEGVTSPPAIVEIFTADERARHLPASDLWTYITEPEFWNVAQEDDGWATARDHVAFFLESALANGLLTPRTIIEGVTLGRLVQYLPEPVLEAMLSSALQQARIHEPFSEDEMMFVATAAVLAEHVPLPDLWHAVIAELAPGSKPVAKKPTTGSGPTPKTRPEIAKTETRIAPLSPPAATPPMTEAPSPSEVADAGDPADAVDAVDDAEESHETDPPSAPAMSPPKVPARGPTIPLPPGKPVPRPPGAMSRPSMAMPEAESGKRTSRRPR